MHSVYVCDSYMDHRAQLGLHGVVTKVDMHNEGSVPRRCPLTRWFLIRVFLRIIIIIFIAILRACHHVLLCQHYCQWVPSQLG